MAVMAAWAGHADGGATALKHYIRVRPGGYDSFIWLHRDGFICSTQRSGDASVRPPLELVIRQTLDDTRAEARGAEPELVHPWRREQA
jgi:hypothetical protein